MDIPELSAAVDQTRGEEIPTIGSDSMADLNNDDVRLFGNIGSTKPKRTTSKPKVTTLFNMNNESSDDDDDGEEGQAFYAGGSERSGQQVLGPPRRKAEGHDVVSEVFRLAQENGAEVVEQRSAGPSGSSSLFAGAGYRLGMTPDDHEALPTTTRTPRPQTIEAVVLKLWRQGFSINNGELRQYEDPVNKEFLNSIKRGEIPNELRQMAGSGTVDFELEDHRHEEYKKPVTKVQAFSGKGHTLGSPAPNVITETPPSKPESNEENQKKATENITIDESQPIAMVQIRLADGSRISGRFNHTHTVNDIRQYVITARPIYENQNFVLLTTFPSKELTDGDATIIAAGLQGSTIMQRLK